MQTSIIIPFRQSKLLLVNHEGQPFVPMKPVVDGMGLSWQGQHAKLSSGRLTSTIKEILIVAEDGKQRQMTCLPLRKLPGWLMSIHPNKVRPELRDNIIAYQNECDDVLWSYWNDGMVVRNDSRTFETVLNSTIGTDGFHCLAAVLDGKLRHLPTKARQRAKMHVWSQVHKAFSVVSAEDIPATQLDSARNFIAAYNVHEGEWLGKEPTINPTLNELDLAMLYVFCIDTLELVYVGEKLKPVFETLRAPLTMNVRKCLGECREAVAHLHERFGPQMEQAARRRKAFDGRRNLAAAGDPNQPIWV